MADSPAARPGRPDPFYLLTLPGPAPVLSQAALGHVRDILGPLATRATTIGPMLEALGEAEKVGRALTDDEARAELVRSQGALHQLRAVLVAALGEVAGDPTAPAVDPALVRVDVSERDLWRFTVRLDARHRPLPPLPYLPDAAAPGSAPGARHLLLGTVQLLRGSDDEISAARVVARLVDVETSEVEASGRAELRRFGFAELTNAVATALRALPPLAAQGQAPAPPPAPTTATTTTPTTAPAPASHPTPAAAPTNG